MLTMVLAALALSDTIPAPAATPRPPADTPPSAEIRQDSVQLKFSGFVDAYYAWDGLRPATLDRAYTTQPARHNEFNINLAFVEATLRTPRIRGRVALQAGTSVQSNYAAEPSLGQVSGGSVSRHLQEGTIGVALTPNLWLDGGVYFSYGGLEGWISRDNATYTRSLIAEYTPYYASGAKVTWTASPRVTAQFHLMNGWQNIAETNSDKAVGARVDFQAGKHLLLAWDMFLGNEAPDTLPSRTRVLQQLIARYTHGAWDVSAVLDGGRQERAGHGADWWTGSTATVRRQISPATALVARVEHLFDRGQVLVGTGSPDGFRTTGASFGMDVTPAPRTLWRTEVRGFRSGDTIWPAGSSGRPSRTSWMAVTSLALTL